MSYLPLSTTEEMKIVALIARGDTYAQIQEEMKAMGRTVTLQTIARAKKRNKENLKIIKTKVVEIEQANALSIKEKANALLQKRLDQVDQETEIVARANKEYLEGDMPHEVYERLMKTMKPTSLPELVSVSKEMHQQSKSEPDALPTPAKDMQALADAIKSGDEVMLNQMIFNPKTEELKDVDLDQPPKESV